MYSKSGLKYFIYKMTINKTNNYMCLPIELREKIWNMAHIYPVIQCYICDKILINFDIDILTISYNDNYSIINGISKCNTCYID